MSNEITAKECDWCGDLCREEEMISTASSEGCFDYCSIECEEEHEEKLFKESKKEKK